MNKVKTPTTKKKTEISRKSVSPKKKAFPDLTEIEEVECIRTRQKSGQLNDQKMSKKDNFEIKKKTLLQNELKNLKSNVLKEKPSILSTLYPKKDVYPKQLISNRHLSEIPEIKYSTTCDFAENLQVWRKKVVKTPNKTISNKKGFCEGLEKKSNTERFAKSFNEMWKDRKMKTYLGNSFEGEKNGGIHLFSGSFTCGVNNSSFK